MKLLMQYLQKPKHLELPDRVLVARDIVKGTQEMGMTFKSAYDWIYCMKDIFERAEWRLKDDAFHAMEGQPVVHVVMDDEKDY